MPQSTNEIEFRATKLCYHVRVQSTPDSEVLIPSYDVECSKCGFEDIAVLKIAELNAWDTDAHCPKCEGGAAVFRRVIRTAPVSYGGDKALEKSAASKKSTQKALFTSSGERDAMRHRESQTRDRHQVAEAVENVKKGRFEGF